MTAYADPELLVGEWLRDTLEIQVRCDPHLRSDWWAQAPVAHVLRGQGLGDVPLSLDDVTLDIGVYASTADNARTVAGQIWSAMTLQLPRTTFANGVFVKRSTALAPPSWGPSERVYRRVAAYRVLLHGFIS